MKKITTGKNPDANWASDNAASYHALRVANLRRFSRLLDEAIPVPGTGRRIGVDALLGLIPGLGDIAGGLLSGYILLIAIRIGVPPAVLMHMLVNIGVDTATGAVPFIGDLFDFVWKANIRNLALLERYLESPTAAHAASRGVMIAALVLLLTLFGITFWLAAASVRALANLFS